MATAYLYFFLPFFAFCHQPKQISEERSCMWQNSECEGLGPGTDQTPLYVNTWWTEYGRWVSNRVWYLQIHNKTNISLLLLIDRNTWKTEACEC